MDRYFNFPSTTALPPMDKHGDVYLYWCVAMGLFCVPAALYQYWVLMRHIFRSAQQWRRGGRTPINVESIRQHSFGESKRAKFESVRQGSEPFTSTWPACQMVLWNMVDEGLERNACAWRFGDYLVTASHCLPSGDDRLFVSTARSDVVVTDYEVIYNHDEIAVCKVPASLFTDLSVRTAKIGGTDDSIVRITGCNPDRSTTSGLLQPTDIFGIYVYSGTTAPGYSGAPYMVGNNSVVAMHLCGGASGNLCVSARYIQMVINQFASKSKPKMATHGVIDPAMASTRKEGKRNVVQLLGESKKKSPKHSAADDWYDEDIAPGTVVRARKSRGDPREYEVQIGSTYYLVDEDALSRLRTSCTRRGARVHVDRSPELVTDDSEAKFTNSVADDDDGDDDTSASFLEESPASASVMVEKSDQSTEILLQQARITTSLERLICLMESKNFNHMESLTSQTSGPIQGPNIAAS
uniref:Serine protease n=1 Tax=Hubei sobemo-like virus 39 TaxID=1923226 RepID=A0A1L3KEI6_9VIRU|nr:hypothetical protein 2 [Hubei sobemo-like virus 39]